MLKALRFVKGAVAKKDYHPVLTFFRISKGRVTGYNGEMALSSPIPLDLEVTPHAVEFIRVLNACEETITIHQTPTGRLAVRSGAFKAFVDCTPEDFPEVVHSGQEITVAGKLLPALKVLAPLTALDASRAWAQGILLRDCSAFATNNVVLAEYWLGFQMAVSVNLPKVAVVELLRIGEEPEKILISDTSCTFYFSGDRWLHTLTYSAVWPNLDHVLNKPSEPKELPKDFWPAVKRLQPFCDKEEAFWLVNGGLSTHQAESTGAHQELPELVLEKPVCFNIKHLLLLENNVNLIDLTGYPGPCYFFGENLRGAIIGRTF